MVDLDNSGRPQILQDEDRFEKEAEKKGILEIFKEVKRVHQSISENLRSCSFIPFQTYAAAKLLSAPGIITVSSIPTGGGKSFIAMLIAQFLTNKGQNVAIVTC